MMMMSGSIIPLNDKSLPGGHACVLQGLDSVAGPNFSQSSPPLFGVGLLHCLLRNLMPPPQLLLHVP